MFSELYSKLKIVHSFNKQVDIRRTCSMLEAVVIENYRNTKSYKSTKSSLEVGNLSKPKLSLKVPSLPNTKIVFLKVALESFFD